MICCCGQLAVFTLSLPMLCLPESLLFNAGEKVGIIGGIGSGRDALEKIQAGADLVQIYSAFTLQGLAVIPRIKHELAALLRQCGHASLGEAVGTGVR